MRDEAPQYVSLIGWQPPWLDDGKRLMEIIQTCQALNSREMWLIMSSLIIRQLELDLSIARIVNLGLREKEENLNDEEG